MVTSIKELVSGLFGAKETRKREDGSLSRWRRTAREARKPQFRVQKPRERTKIGPRRVTRRTTNDLKTVQSKGWLDRIKSVFSSEEDDLKAMEKAYAGYTVTTGVPQTLHTRSQIQRRIANSAALKRRLLEKQYDDRMLDELRRVPRKALGPKRLPHASEMDQVILLETQLADVTQRLATTKDELRVMHKKLKFATEKNSLLESLIDDTNIDDDYLKSRRRITNLQRNDLKPAPDTLLPSPVHHVAPLVTSSPSKYRIPADILQDTELDFYAKYPTIPKAENFKNDPNDLSDHSDSLSPIRVDYSKYNSSHVG
ncbi:LAMI_0E04918g1_1 [Lachancea mirantina]|uniref:LAMI_0E04918g1_1 n=1 Tax=Lachancea mirantina TaxID=1230905 RepID=A0A1G4JKQ7_9SACH|nr:LAMI_0E04918g1_1 [Lachancea mirantina]